jgi:hypothetical protein
VLLVVVTVGGLASWCRPCAITQANIVLRDALGTN